jgi:hypothetical protein
MLAMLTKELLYDMGIKAVGDVLQYLPMLNKQHSLNRTLKRFVISNAIFVFLNFVLYLWSASTCI